MMKKYKVCVSLLLSAMLLGGCGSVSGSNANSGSSNSALDGAGGSSAELTASVDLGSDPEEYMLYGRYVNEEWYKGDYSDYAESHAVDFDYMTLQLEDSEACEVEILPVEIEADMSFLDSSLDRKTDQELKDELGLTEKQIAAIHEYQQYDHMRISYVMRKKYSEDGEYSYSTNNCFQFAYEVVGDKLYMGLAYLITDEEDENYLKYYMQDRDDWLEYSYGFDGLDLILSKDGQTTKLKCSHTILDKKNSNGELYEWGYAKDSSSGYDGIIHLTLTNEEDNESSIEWADGRRAQNVTTQIDGNQFTLTWESTYCYDYEQGKSEEGTGGELSGTFLITQRPYGGMAGGLSICIDGKWYPYVNDSSAYWNGELNDNLSADSDVSNMSEEELGALKETQSEVTSGLMGAFKEQGLDSARVDENTGTVQMDTNVLFAKDKSDLSEEGKSYLNEFLAAYVPVISKAIEEGKVSTIVVEGYTDSSGEEEHNQTLSEERAKTVADYIESAYPELSGSIEMIGNGENDLILDEDGKEDAAASRRVEVRYVLKAD